MYYYPDGGVGRVVLDSFDSLFWQWGTTPEDLGEEMSRDVTQLEGIIRQIICVCGVQQKMIQTEATINSPFGACTSSTH